MTGTMKREAANGLAEATIATDASSAASRTEEELDPHSSSAAASRGTTNGSVAFNPNSQSARSNNNAPSLAFAGVVFPRLESVPIVDVPIDILEGMSSVAPVLSILARLTADAIFLIPPPG